MTSAPKGSVKRTTEDVAHQQYLFENDVSVMAEEYRELFDAFEGPLEIL